LKGAKIKPRSSLGEGTRTGGIIDSDLDAFVVAFYAMVRVKLLSSPEEE
jgi:hypothetical protein